MKIRVLAWIAMVFGAAFLLLSGESILMQRAIADKTLRLHVVANSDKPEDQEQKLRVRDRILQKVAEMTEGCQTLAQTEAALQIRLWELEKCANDLLKEEGSPYAATVTLCKEDFSTREYDTFALPAGRYHSLRVVIGQGGGKNWWCVVFPSLCNAATGEELEAAALEGGYGEEELAMIRREQPKYTIRFKILELAEGLFH